MAVNKSCSSLLIALLLIFAAPGRVAAEDETASKRFDVSGFTRIALEGSSQVQIVQGDHYEVVATGPADAMAYAKAEVRGDTLELSVEAEKKSWFGVITVSIDPGVEYRVTMPVIEGVKVAGSGAARAETLESKDLELRVTGSGSIRIDKVAAEALSASVTGSGDLSAGTVLAVNGQAAIMGSGDLRMDNFVGEQLTASIKGSGDMAVGGRVVDLQINLMGSGDFIGRRLHADIAVGSVMGSGDIVIRRPAKDSFSVMGSGDVALID
ncbi:DUF2807 domain-containing protein [Microbulbifer thermotolerans]|uniref:DUF2807 domain-containing protein n=1 Tax=Microbulbifer thermotolerans TaxID=252514 RepID=A0AB35HXB8_MICTH|nr:DUF2807 domain-containing protein [Microbulbifer thermotolerans]MCX2782572.1 DUF2807 domain-containing protein [Microbulbifer thermotolerans]MCX2801412.1 DUF2807 domain-containing protein [Microbulbifer thermotolerans]MCX2831673.1 DUF2807 domain-containing protein [Microbulbifer thermotolerans]WKT59222.1 DUF2807 domain-containing protein [Microbulbifer thermotolerans]